MDKFITSSDGQAIHYCSTGEKKTALLFVHGWLGNAAWWNFQKEYFSRQYTIVQIDLPGHGLSDKSRINWSSKQYAEDIRTVAEEISCQNMVLVGHSMSGAYVLEASLMIKKVKAVVLVDTLKDMDKLMSVEQAEQFLFSSYKKDFPAAVTKMLPQYLFAANTPAVLKDQLQNEFLTSNADLAVKVIEPLYKMNTQEIAKQISIPIRAIYSSYTAANPDANRKYFRDYDFVTIPDCGHYPMLEKPEEFNQVLENILNSVAI